MVYEFNPNEHKLSKMVEGENRPDFNYHSGGNILQESACEKNHGSGIIL